MNFVSGGLAVVAALMTAGIGPDAKTTRCPVTPPNGRPLMGLFGNGKLAAPTYYPTITVTPRHMRPDGSIGEKFPWRGYGVDGDLKITGQRLDARARPLRASINPGWAAGADSFWAVGIIFPTPGCWRITGTVDNARLTFVTRVVDPSGYWKPKR